MIFKDKELCNFQVQSYTISVSAGPTSGGSVSGGGTYNHGESCTVSATANNGYTFTNWTEGGNVVSTNANYTFTVTDDRTLVAHFVVQAPNTYNINVSANPPAGGTVTGGGSYQQGQQCTVTATENEGYTFLRWTENGNQVSPNLSYTFEVTGNRTLVAHFQVRSYTIGVSADPSDGGTVTGGGTYTHGQNCEVTAAPATGYNFIRWTENGNQVSTNPNYSFTVTGNRTLVAQFQAQQYTITATANPTNGGTISGNQSPYTYGQTCSLTATPANSNYTFANWTENGNVVSTQANYSFTVNGNRTLVANFTYVPPTYTITVNANPTNGGQVTGGGTYNYGTTVNLTANANSGFNFGHWQDGNTNNPRTITVTGNATYTAYFEAQSQAPVGAINGLFTINSNGDQVYFSQGNLQYKAYTNTWRFATNQWDCVGGTDSDGNSYGNVSGSSNNNISQTYSGWIDLFGWGTSGYHDSSDPENVIYQPWSTSTAIVGGYNWYGYGPSTNMPSPNLTGSSANYDWGIYNTVYSGNVTTSGWRTLTGGNDDNAEWYYVFNRRTTPSGILYAKANVNNVNGVILLPDDWSASYYSLSSPNTHNANYNSNIISASQWSTLEQHGAVFLPSAGYRNGTSVRNYLFGEGLYWSTSYSNESSAWHVNFSLWHIGFIGDDYGRPYGNSVRLVYPVN